MQSQTVDGALVGGPEVACRFLKMAMPHVTGFPFSIFLYLENETF